MIKAAGQTGDGIPLLFLGLSGENITRLTAGEPIHIPADQLAEIGLPGIAVIIHYGRTEAAILAELKRVGVPVVG